MLALLACSTDYDVTKDDNVLAVSPSVVDFGALPVWTSAEATVTLAHAGGGAVEVLALDVLEIEGSGFSVAGSELPRIDVDETAGVTLLYAPSSEGWHRAQLTVVTDEEGGGEHVVDLRGYSGTPRLSVAPGRHDFGPVQRGEDASATFTLYNEGDVDFTLESATFDDGIFSTDAALPTEVSAGSAFDLVVTVSPRSADPIQSAMELAVWGGEAPIVRLLANACEDGEPSLYDGDDDGWASCAGDCDDGANPRHPGAVEVCDGADDDCDGDVDEGTSCHDGDGDGLTEDEGDCADGDAAVYAGAEEDLDNGVDDDCDGVVDLGADDPDGDGFTSTAGDCDESDAAVFPGAPESADGRDEDCDGLADEGTSAWDDDADGTSEDAGDCDDTDAAVHPGVAETGNGADDDCDGTIDEGTTWADDDGDGWSDRGGDCDDTKAAVNPGAVEVTGDSTDNDCDGVKS